MSSSITENPVSIFESRYIAAVLWDFPKEKRIPIPPALKKLKIGKIDTIEELEKVSGHILKLMKSYNVTREYIDFQKHLAPRISHFYYGCQPTEYNWSLDDSFGVLPTHQHASFALTSMFDFFHPKSIEAGVKYTSLRKDLKNSKTTKLVIFFL